MKKKSIVVLLLAMVMCLMLGSCGKKTVEDARNLILESNNMIEALSQFESLMEAAESKEEKTKIEAAMNDYLLEDINGFYYYARPDKAEMHVDSDSRTIYVTSKDEVYIVPYSEEQLADMKVELEDISQIENSEVYKYHVVEIKSGKDKYENVYNTKITLKSDYIGGDELDAFNSIRIECWSGHDPMEYQFIGYFADEQNIIPDSDRELGWPAVRGYFRDKDTSRSQKAERDVKESNWGEPKEKESPAIGMTKSEILNSTWGRPDKKNIDEYEWGTEEQWVYDGKGYIYFENGIVDAIQHR